MVQLSQQYVTTGKTIVLTIQTFVSRVMSLLFNTLSRFVIAFLPRSNHLSDFMAAVTVQFSTMQFSSVTWMELYKRSLLLILYSDLALRRAVTAGPEAWTPGALYFRLNPFPWNLTPTKQTKSLGLPFLRPVLFCPSDASSAPPHS